MALALDEDRADILRLVQTKMGRIAPNLSAVVGTAIAAQLMGVAGGLSSLSQMPACNIQVGHGSGGLGLHAQPELAVADARVQHPGGARDPGFRVSKWSPKMRFSAVLGGQRPELAIAGARVQRPGGLVTTSVDWDAVSVQVLGAKRKSLAGFSTAAAQPHHGSV